MQNFVRLEIAELRQMELEIFQEVVDEVCTLFQRSDGRGLLVVDCLQIMVQEQRQFRAESTSATETEAAIGQIEQGFATAVVVQGQDAQVPGDGEKESDRLMREFTLVKATALNHIVE